MALPPKSASVTANGLASRPVIVKDGKDGFTLARAILTCDCFFVALGFILRNVRVWIHQTRLAEGSGRGLKLHLELLRFKRMLDWIVHGVVDLLHDGSTPYVTRPP
jgi:hypothetical protein